MSAPEATAAEVRRQTETESDQDTDCERKQSLCSEETLQIFSHHSTAEMCPFLKCLKSKYIVLKGVSLLKKKKKTKLIGAMGQFCLQSGKNDKINTNFIWEGEGHA